MRILIRHQYNIITHLKLIFMLLSIVFTTKSSNQSNNLYFQNQLPLDSKVKPIPNREAKMNLKKKMIF